MVSKITTVPYDNFARIIVFKLNVNIIRFNVDGCLAPEHSPAFYFPRPALVCLVGLSKDFEKVTRLLGYLHIV